jgi:hypothetical protein
VLAFLGERMSVPPTAWFDYDLNGRSVKRDGEQVRGFLGFRPIEVADERRLCRWRDTEVAPRSADGASEDRSCRLVPSTTPGTARG